MSRLLTFLPAPLLLAGTALADAPNGYPGGGYYGHPMLWGDGHGFFGVGLMLVFWGIVIFLAVLAVRWFMGQGPGQGKNSALDILKERLARGEIDPEEYEARRKALES